MFCLQSWNVSHAVFQVRIKNVTSKEDRLPVRLARTYVKYDYNRYASNWKLISYAFLKKHFHCSENLRYLFHKEMRGYGGSKDKENSEDVCVRMYSKMWF